MTWLKQFLTWAFNSNKEHIKTAVEIIQNIKNLRDEKKQVYLTDVIPGRFNAVEQDKLLTVTKTAIYLSEIVKTFEILPELLKALRSMDETERHEAYRTIAGNIIKQLIGMDIIPAKQAAGDYYDVNREEIIKL